MKAIEKWRSHWIFSVIYDPNDPELKESLKYLALPAEERIKLQAQPFDGKKQCWVPDAKESFVAGEITETKGEQVTVKTSKGDVRQTNWIEVFHHSNIDFHFSVSYFEKRWHSTDESTEIHLLWWYG